MLRCTRTCRPDLVGHVTAMHKSHNQHCHPRQLLRLLISVMRILEQTMQRSLIVSVTSFFLRLTMLTKTVITSNSSSTPNDPLHGLSEKARKPNSTQRAQPKLRKHRFTLDKRKIKFQSLLLQLSQQRLRHGHLSLGVTEPLS